MSCITVMVVVVALLVNEQKWNLKESGWMVSVL